MASISLENLIGRTRNLVDALDWPDPQPADVIEPLAGFLAALGDLVEPMSNIRVTAEGEHALKAALADAADALGELVEQIGKEAVRSGLTAAGVLISSATLHPRERRAVAPTLLQPRVSETKILAAILGSSFSKTSERLGGFGDGRERRPLGKIRRPGGATRLGARG
ncbi:MAG: hypothetical protein DI534_16580 [Leifsonia xyli]|nr:MAG: hypothetical protein DI534_16580 [Leifsonia xyli]